MNLFAPVVAVLLCFASPASAAERQLKIAFVLLSRSELPQPAEVVRAFASYAPKGESLRASGPPAQKPGRAEEVQQFELGTGGTVFVALIPAPVPRGEADEVARYSISSLGTGWKLPGHKAHLLVTISQEGGRKLDVLTRFTSVLAAV